MRMSTTKIVLAVSDKYDTGRCPVGDVPKKDFVALAEATGAIIVGQSEKNSGIASSLERALALDFRQALRIVREYPDADAYVSFSERIGIPLGALLSRRRRRPAHIMIAHRLATPAKLVQKWLYGWPRGIDRIITFCNAQYRIAERVAPGRASFIRVGVTDQKYFIPKDVPEHDYVLSVGSEKRDYNTLIAASEKLEQNVKLLTSSPWCRSWRPDVEVFSSRIEFLPRVDYPGLRDLYQKAKMIVLPLFDVDYAAGHNGVLEAFCVCKPLIVSGSRGIIDYVDHLNNAYVVPCGDITALASAMNEISNNPDLASQLKDGAAEAVKQFANLDFYIQSMKQEIGCVLDAR